MFVGTTGSVTKRNPLFKIHPTFASSTGLKVKNFVTDTPSVSVLPLSFIIISSDAGVSKDVASLGFNFIIQALTDIVSSSFFYIFSSLPLLLIVLNSYFSSMLAAPSRWISALLFLHSLVGLEPSRFGLKNLSVVKNELCREMQRKGP
jgi:hypothetical protein